MRSRVDLFFYLLLFSSSSSWNVDRKRELLAEVQSAAHFFLFFCNCLDIYISFHPVVEQGVFNTRNSAILVHVPAFSFLFLFIC